METLFEAMNEFGNLDDLKLLSSPFQSDVSYSSSNQVWWPVIEDVAGAGESDGLQNPIENVDLSHVSVPSSERVHCFLCSHCRPKAGLEKRVLAGANDQ